MKSHSNCPSCGEMICYADDATVLNSSNSRQSNLNKLNQHLDKINDFLMDNKLVINKEKTTITEVMIRQKRVHITGQPPSLSVLDNDNSEKELNAEKYTRLLGGNISDNLCWNDHLETGEKALLLRLRKQLGALNLLARQLPRASRLLLANGLLLSKISYLIQIWGAMPKSQLRKVQKILNSAARFVTKRDKWTPTQILMSECRWLRIEDMVTYYSLLSLWNTVHRKIPGQTPDKLTIDVSMMITIPAPRLLTVAHGYLCRTIASWNQLDDETRTLVLLPRF